MIVEDFGDHAFIFDAVFWIFAHSETDLRVIRSNVRFRIYDVFNEHDIVIAFPQRDVHLNGQLTLKQASKQASKGLTSALDTA